MGFFNQSSTSGHHLLSLPFICSFSPSSYLVFQWGERVRATLLAAVLAIESLHKTEICSGSGQSHNQIKSSQVSCSEAIHSHHKMALYLCFQSVSLLLAIWLILGTGISPFSINPRSLISRSRFFLFNSACRRLLECFTVHHVRFISKYTVAKCTVCLLVLRRDLLPVKKSYVHWGVLHPDSW